VERVKEVLDCSGVSWPWQKMLELSFLKQGEKKEKQKSPKATNLEIFSLVYPNKTKQKNNKKLSSRVIVKSTLIR